MKALRIKCALPDYYLTNLPIGLEMLYVEGVIVNNDGNWTLAKDLVDLNLPPTLNYFYINIGWCNPPYKLPYGCKMKRFYPCDIERDRVCPILKRMKRIYRDNQIKNIYSQNEFEEYFDLKIKKFNLFKD